MSLAPLFGPGSGSPSAIAWALLAALLVSGMATVVAMSRAGIDAFWTSSADTMPRVRMLEIGPVLLLLALCLALTVWPGPVMHYMQATAQSLHAPQDYVRAVFPVPPSSAPEEEGGQ